MSRKGLFVLLASVLLFACGKGYTPLYIRAYIPNQVTTDRLLSLKNGMTYGEIEKTIGPPVCWEAEDVGFSQSEVDRLTAGCATSRSTRRVPSVVIGAKDLTLSYAEPMGLFTEPRIYVNLHAGRLGGVYIKYQDFGICCMSGQPNSPFYSIGSRDVLRKLVGR